MAKKDGKHLVIVESPAKAKTINKYLGDDYVVRASMGHVRDLPSKGMGVDLETFEPDYEVLASRGKVISELKKLAKTAPDVYLATDLDREGEAIAWHLKEALNIPDEGAHRVIFNAITRDEIKRAFSQPHHIDINRVNAQQARRILDRIVGYEISPLLWRKVAKGLSAGRVQSVAVRLIVEREREISAFVPEEYWTLGSIFTPASAEEARELGAEWRDFLAGGEEGDRSRQDKDKWLAGRQAFSAELVEINGKKADGLSQAEARQAAVACGFVLEHEQVSEDEAAKGPARQRVKLLGRVGDAPTFTVRGIERKRSSSRAPAPLITSTLQQAASSRLGYGAQRTMRLAQKLYEAGYITYMRTDSTHLSSDAISMARSYIGRNLGKEYLPEKPNFFASSNKSAQEAHEAIRPTDASLDPAWALKTLAGDESRLYSLIWMRFIACQMPAAQFDQTAVSVVARTKVGEAVFRATGRKLVFDGFMRVMGIASEDQLLPELQEGQPLQPVDLSPAQHFTQPPPRFTEASLVKELERLGIGRPSTYASIIQTIQDRKYVEQMQRRFHATLLGMIVTDKLVQGFPQIMDVTFTADMENKLDQIEAEHLDWVKLLKEFYGPFHQGVQEAMGLLDHAGGTATDYKCQKCGAPMVYRISKGGFFLACSDRECKTTQPVDSQGKPKVREVSEFKCPQCGREMIKRQGRFGVFLGCSGYSEKNEKGEPACSLIINLDREGRPTPPKAAPVPTGIACAKCGGEMMLREGKRGPWLGCGKFPKCRAMLMPGKLTPEQRAKVDELLPQVHESAEKGRALVSKLTGIEHVPVAKKPAAIKTDIECLECGKPMVLRQGPRGAFLGCSGYPKCRSKAEATGDILEQYGLAPQALSEGAGEAPAEELPADLELE